MQTSKDVIGFLKAQHKEIKGLFEQVVAGRGLERHKAFTQLQKLMAAHEAAEEKVVHPAAEAALPQGESEVAAREKEEAEAKRSLTALATLDVNSSEFEAKIRVLQSAVLAHAATEEKEEFDRLEDKLEPATLQKMRSQVEAVEAETRDASKQR